MTERLLIAPLAMKSNLNFLLARILTTQILTAQILGVAGGSESCRQKCKSVCAAHLSKPYK
jgi:hypothetical protein